MARRKGPRSQAAAAAAVLAPACRPARPRGSAACPCPGPLPGSYAGMPRALSRRPPPLPLPAEVPQRRCRTGGRELVAYAGNASTQHRAAAFAQRLRTPPPPRPHPPLAPPAVGRAGRRRIPRARLGSPAAAEIFLQGSRAAARLRPPPRVHLGPRPRPPAFPARRVLPPPAATTGTCRLQASSPPRPRPPFCSGLPSSYAAAERCRATATARVQFR
ncbi:hypothetical protein PVAP13_2KG075874 [Panicum virgatum]|uniref:Uncharacterized protein n=1 Tax=Panicum virgatum TaxID=38727 RepID=A0A8T0VWZ6_PANVG|nr:hypothetical protein PVAP13_2KG075874 [Panicum virgatum]